MVLRAVDLGGKHRLLWESSGDLKLEDVARDGTAVVTVPRRYMGLAMSSKDADRDLSIRDEQMLQDLSPDGSRVLFTVNPRSPDGQGVLFVRGTDGSPPLQIATGFAGALSPDGKAALVFPWGDPARAPALVPLGPGESRIVVVPHARRPHGVENQRARRRWPATFGLTAGSLHFRLRCKAAQRRHGRAGRSGPWSRCGGARLRTSARQSHIRSSRAFCHRWPSGSLRRELRR